MRPRTLLALLLAALGLYALIDWLVVTDRERIERLVEDTRAAVVRGDWTAVAANVDDDFTGDRRNKAGFVEFVRSTWTSLAIPTVDVDVDDVDVEGEKAAARVRARALRTTVTARVQFVRREAGWKIFSVDEIAPVAGWGR